MGEHVLVPYDGSPLSQRALDRALTTAGADTVTALYVIDPMLAVYRAEMDGLPAASGWHEEMEAHAESVCRDAADSAADHGREIATATTVGRPAREIVAYVDDHDIDHIMLGSHGRRGILRLLLGSVAEQVLRRSPVPVTVVR